MRKFVLLILIAVIYSCSDNTEQMQSMQTQINALKNKLDSVYTPGFGEFMSAIQVHHDKLWFAGSNQNWKLAAFEVHEIKESLQDLQKYQSDKPESNSLPMIYPALDSVYMTIRSENLNAFRSNFAALTNTCNSCHKTVNYEFNNVKIPDNPPFDNQVFKPVKK